MCGRYTLRKPAHAFRAVLQRAVDEDRPARYNVAPGEQVPVVVAEDSARRLADLQWGLVPRWTSPESKVAPIVNARAETARSRPSFRDSFLRRRCAVPADGFYEWRKAGGQRQPFFFFLRSDHPFALAGLWDEWRRPSGETLRTFCLLTTEANPVVAQVHHRMPVLLAGDGIEAWLRAPEAEVEERLFPLLQPFPAEQMEARAVDPWVNKAGREGPRCVQPWEGEERDQLSLF